MTRDAFFHSPPGRLIGYGFFVALSIVTLITGQRLDQADLSVPLHYEGDTLLILPLVKCTIETGTHWRNERLGAPGIQELHDFPIVDHMHFALLWFLGQVLPTYVHAFNLYHLSSYPLIVLTTMIVLRRFGASCLAAGLAGMLYAFLPYHYIRGLGHYFLSAYWTLPLTLWPALALLANEPPFFRDGKLRLLTWPSFGTVLIAAMTASAGAYYAFFGCLVLSFCGLYMCVAGRSWKPLISATLVSLLIVLGGIANHLPAILYQAEFGRNSEPTRRMPHEAEEYGLKLAQMLLPVRDHHWKSMADLRARYDDPNRVCQNENESSSLGLIGSLSLVSLLVTVFWHLARERLLPHESAHSQNQGSDASCLLMQGVTSLVLFLVLYGSIGGVGSVFNFLVTPQVRSVNRISIVIAFFVFLAVAKTFDRLLMGRHWLLRLTSCLFVTAIGVSDETNRQWFKLDNPVYREISGKWNEDRDFFCEIQSTGVRGPIFCLPFIAYPETHQVGFLSGYDHVRGYLHTASLAWSFGAIKGRETDQWQRELESLPVPDLIDRLVLNGFEGILIDRDGYQSLGDFRVLLAQIQTVVRAEDGQFEYKTATGRVFIPLIRFRDALKKRIGEADCARRSLAEHNTPRVLWLDGFLGYDPKHRWCGSTGTAVVINPTDESRTIRASMVLRSSTATPGELTVDGGDVWRERFALTSASPEIVREWLVPPGRHTITFRYRPSRDHSPHDARNLSWFVALFRLEEVYSSR